MSCVLDIEDFANILIKQKQKQCIPNLLTTVNVSFSEKNVCHYGARWMNNRPELRHLWQNSYSMPSLSALRDSDVIYIPGGIKRFGARYPTFLITQADVVIIKAVMKHWGIFKEDDFKTTILNCCQMVQFYLNTDAFNNACDKTKEWEKFDEVALSFLEKCYNIPSYQNIKGSPGDVVLNVSLLLFGFGDCREHNILMHVILKILIEETDLPYLVSSVYSAGEGYLSAMMNGVTYEHVFPLLWSSETHQVFAVDALFSKTNLVPYPLVDNTTFEPLRAMPDPNVRGEYIYISGNWTTCPKGAPGQLYAFKPTAFSGLMCKISTTQSPIADTLWFFNIRLKKDLKKLIDLATNVGFSAKRIQILWKRLLCV